MKVGMVPGTNTQSSNGNNLPAHNLPLALRLNVDLIEDTRFSLSDHAVIANGPDSAIKRLHWQHLSENSECSLIHCKTGLNMRNGMSNCHKCGRLFCSKHCAHMVRLANATSIGPPSYSCTKNGTWLRCCLECYFNKPDLLQDTIGMTNDRTRSFGAMRKNHAELTRLLRIRTRNKFIHLVNSLLNDRKTSLLFQWPAKRIKWDNNHLTSCEICYTRFSVLLRKHHCRLCGRSVCQSAFGERTVCSIMVPLCALLARLPTLNYSESVKLKMDYYIKQDTPRFRCCIDCKDILLLSLKLPIRSKEECEYLESHRHLFSLRDSANLHVQKYTKAVNERIESIPKLSARVVALLNSFEAAIQVFMDQWVQHPPLLYKNSIFNEYNAHIDSFQKLMLDFKLLARVYLAHQQAQLRKAQADAAAVDSIPRLSKLQIRELREQLMVMNEQKYLIEKMMSDATKQRKFDDRQLLQNNSNELDRVIQELELKLGEFGF